MLKSYSDWEVYNKIKKAWAKEIEINTWVKIKKFDR